MFPFNHFTHDGNPATEVTILFLQIAFAAFFSILFLQSGLDKVFDFKGNLSWLTGHFGKSPLAKVVPMMLVMVTITEVACGALSLVGLGMLILKWDPALAWWGIVLALLNFLQLFFGQRLAKDYVGAATLVPYFIAAVIGLLVMSFSLNAPVV